MGIWWGISLAGIAGFFLGISKGMAVGFSFSMFLSLIFWLILPKEGLVLSIKSRDRIRWSFKDVFFIPDKEWLGNLMAGIVVWTLFGWIMNNFIGLIAIVIGLFGFIISIFWLWFYEMVNRSHNPILQISKPYERLRNSLFVFHYAIFDHWLLRWQLYRAGVLPLRLVDFLNETSERHLLETDGATWHFRHRILQKHFAGQWKKASGQNT